jgi:hypothetical protein
LDSLFISLNAVVPLFLMMAVGYVIRLTGLMNDISARQVNRCIFKVFLPLMLFINIYDAGDGATLRSDLLFFAVAGVLIEFLVSLVLVLLTEQDNSRRGVMLQGMFRSNFVLFGIPIAMSLFGDSAAGTASLLIAIVIPMFNALAVLALEMFNGQRPNLWGVLFGIATNPLIIASLLGIAFNHFGWYLPGLLHDTMSTLGGIATPLAFVVLGASMNFSETGRCMRPLLITLLMKLIIYPAAFVGAAILMGFRGANLAVLLTVFGSPIAVSSFTMAQQMGGDDQLAGQLVIFSSILSIGTMFLYIWGLNYFGFF